MTPETIQIITLSLTVLGIIFGIYIYFRNPQEETDKKATILAQQVHWEKEANEKRFAEMGSKITEAMTIAQNHINTVDTKMDKQAEAFNLLSLQVVKVVTILEERLPGKIQI